MTVNVQNNSNSLTRTDSMDPIQLPNVEKTYKTMAAQYDLTESSAKKLKEKPDSTHKATLDLTQVQHDALNKASPTFKLIDAEKFNVIVPPGKLITLNFEMNHPTNSSKINKTSITLTNTKGSTAKLLSFSFDNEGKPMMRGEKDATELAALKRNNVKHSETGEYKVPRYYRNCDALRKYQSINNKLSGDKREMVEDHFYLNLSDEKNQPFVKSVANKVEERFTDTGGKLSADQKRRAKYNEYNEQNPIKEAMEQLIGYYVKASQHGDGGAITIKGTTKPTTPVIKERKNLEHTPGCHAKSEAQNHREGVNEGRDVPPTPHEVNPLAPEYEDTRSR